MGKTARERMIRWFDRSTDELAGSLVLRGIGVEELRRLFGVAEDDPMYDCYRVTSKQAGPLQEHLDAAFDLDRYEYFVEADAAENRRRGPGRQAST